MISYPNPTNKKYLFVSDAKKQMPNELFQENGDNEADSETDDDDEDLDEEKVTNQDENVEKIENLNAIPLPAQET